MILTRRPVSVVLLLVVWFAVGGQVNDSAADSAGTECSSVATKATTDAPAFSADPTGSKGVIPGPHCGVYCLMAAAKLLGVPCEITDVLKTDYVPTRKGSPMRLLRQAALDLGLYADVFLQLSASDLSHLPGPAILHVVSDGPRTEFDHYILLLDAGKTHVWTYDPPGAPEWMSKDKLAACWDGSAIVLSDRPIPTWHILSRGYLRSGGIALLGIGFLLLLHRWSCTLSLCRYATRKDLVRKSVVQAALIGTTVVACACLYELLWGGRIIAATEKAARVMEPRRVARIPTIGYERVTALLKQPGTVLVDARLKQDYDNEHIDNALSIPANLPPDQQAERLKSVARDTAIVLYCQSKGCPFARKVALSLMNNGFWNVSVYQGGWTDWAERRKR